MAPKSLCLTTAFAPVPAFLGGSCPLGCSLSAPATGGCSVFSLQCNMYAAGSEKEKRAGGPLHGATIAQSFGFCNRGRAGASDSGVRPPMGTDGLVLACALHQRRVWLGVRRCPTSPPSNVLGNRGTPPVPPAGAAPPAPCLGQRRRRRFLAWRVGTRFLTCPEESGQAVQTPFLTFPRVRGQGQRVAPVAAPLSG